MSEPTFDCNQSNNCSGSSVNARGKTQGFNKDSSLSFILLGP